MSAEKCGTSLCSAYSAMMAAMLSVSSYVEAEDTRPQTDIKELNARIARIVEHENKLRVEIDAIIRELESETI